MDHFETIRLGCQAPSWQSSIVLLEPVKPHQQVVIGLDGELPAKLLDTPGTSEPQAWSPIIPSPRLSTAVPLAGNCDCNMQQDDQTHCRLFGSELLQPHALRHPSAIWTACRSLVCRMVLGTSTTVLLTLKTQTYQHLPSVSILTCMIHEVISPHHQITHKRLSKAYVWLGCLV
jgi:hypothetical protein